MGRPKQDKLNAPLEQQIEDAFWRLSEKNPIERISVVALSKEAHCNRGTFYYYFTDIYQLLDRIIEKNLPSRITPFLEAAQNGTLSIKEMQRIILDETEHLDRLASLLSRSTSPYTTRHLKNSAIKVWARSMGLEAEELSASDRLFFEFMVGGVFNVLAYRAEHPNEATYQEIFNALMPEVPAALLSRVKRRSQPAATQQGQQLQQ